MENAGKYLTPIYNTVLQKKNPVIRNFVSEIMLLYNDFDFKCIFMDMKPSICACKALSL